MSDEERPIDSTPTEDGHRIYLDAPFVPKKVCVRVDGREFWFEHDASCDYLLGKLVEKTRKLEALQDD
jgi:hypothetical protein